MQENPPIPWMAPEIFLSNNYFPQSETWNLSVFLWELLTIGNTSLLLMPEHLDQTSDCVTSYYLKGVCVRVLIYSALVLSLLGK